MSAAGEVGNPAVEKPSEEAPAEEQPQPAEKPVKEKKPKEKKPKTQKTVSHPPYFQMIKEALVALDEKSGSSPYAIAKYMEEKHKAVLPANFRKILRLQLKNSAARGKLMKIRASYKLSEATKMEKVAAKPTRAASEKKPKPAKPASTGAAQGKGTKRKAGTEKKKKTAKPVMKKTRKSAASKAKQPKSIKSPAAKKAKRATAA